MMRQAAALGSHVPMEVGSLRVLGLTGLREGFPLSCFGGILSETVAVSSTAPVHPWTALPTAGPREEGSVLQ